MATTFAASLKEAKNSAHPLSRLIRFFAKYPPAQYSMLATGQAIPTSRQRVAMNAKPLSSTNVPQATSIEALDDQSMSGSDSNNAGELANTIKPQPQSTIASLDATMESAVTHPPNPFLPYRNPETGRWRGARIGLRQQADLFKHARTLDMEELLPPSIKSSTFKQQRALERGLQVRGTGEGQHVKGHKWERTMVGTLEKRRKAMEEMPEMIRLWEQRGHGRGWKKYPRAKATKR